MSQIDAHLVEGPQSNQFRTSDLPSAAQSTLATDWVEVPDISQHSVVAPALHREQEIPLPLCDGEDSLNGAVLVDAIGECDHCALALPVPDVHAQTKVSESLKEEVHVARAKARHTRFVFQQAAKQLDAIERRVREQDDQTAADCGCMQCIGKPNIDDDARSESSNTSVDIPPPVEQCFEYEREAFVCNERLEELDMENMEYKLSQEIRERDGELRHDLNAAFEESEKIYTRKRQELSAALAIAHYRLFVRRNACMAQGLDPENFRYRHR